MRKIRVIIPIIIFYLQLVKGFVSASLYILPKKCRISQRLILVSLAQLWQRTINENVAFDVFSRISCDTVDRISIA